jgi:hypothetical protein
MPNEPTPEAAVSAQPLPDSLRPLAAEAATYFRELSRLVAEGHEGRCVLIRGDKVESIWDTFDDACQAGRERFGFTPFLAQPIAARDYEWLSLYFAAPAPAEAG